MASEQFKQKARDAGFVSLNDAWIPGVYVDMNRPVMGEFVKVATPMGPKSAQVVAEVDQIIRNMVNQDA